jgi:DNA-binding NarL/FixJ family response regulator
MNVLLADDHRLLLEGLNNLLTAHGVRVAGMARDGLEAVALARRLEPDVILMDIRMPRCDGLEATRRIKAEMPQAKIVILTTSTEDQDLFEAVKSGASGYLLKSMDAEELVEALEQAQQGIPPFSPGLAARLLHEFARLAGAAPAGSQGPASASLLDYAVRHGDPLPGVSDAGQAIPSDAQSASRLTPRQREVLTLVAQGLAYKEVGARLGLSPRTVKYHMAEMMQQLHLEHRAQLLAYAGRAGLGGDTPAE